MKSTLIVINYPANKPLKIVIINVKNTLLILKIRIALSAYFYRKYRKVRISPAPLYYLAECTPILLTVVTTFKTSNQITTTKNITKGK